MLYFAYGSNMLTARLQQRVPSATAVTSGHIERQHLVFNKLGKDGSGKANIEPHPHQRVYGVVYRMDPCELGPLDQAESLGVGYEHHRVTVQSALGEQEILTYRAIKLATGLKPYRWYLDLMLSGAMTHGLPPDYIAALATCPAALDPDSERRRRHHSLLNMSITA
ncbi:hypothetical protein C1752_03689 [Acaryochloris thomasi RCC1774]|uniref:Gamma-glutamylcyclotransferase AIG2-like domain-containing protein n=1 Tax=Acaryochloris thomasi RCC1774 TaxID=1764569 RepID=A0A2W1JFJ4_9CYAN|nr:gamma-glutamylcyclotransferase family protein [Acaryochloris thomasi]PZD72483.1 hypothetical protein C1752_03689 [Acaryochloris thomasi RCC1774]